MPFRSDENEEISSVKDIQIVLRERVLGESERGVGGKRAHTHSVALKIQVGKVDLFAVTSMRTKYNTAHSQ